MSMKMKDSTFNDILAFLDAVDLHGKGIPTKGIPTMDATEPGASEPPSRPAAAAAADSAATSASADADGLVQYVIVRRDLLKPPLDWPVGSVIAQACHACLAVVWEHREDPEVVAYLAATDSMHKVVKECKGEPQLRTLAARLAAEGVAHKLWIEQPEGIPTAIALKPYPRSRVQHVVKKFQLLK